MKLLHIADLHIGKRIHEKSLLEDQTYILDQILTIADVELPEGILIAGDIYDKSVPLERGIILFDYFMTALYQKGIRVFLISGNHDSGERLQFGARILEERNVFVAGVYRGELEKVTMKDDVGGVNVYLLPFIKPGHVRTYFEGIETYQDAVRAVIEKEEIDITQRNILVAHQFITHAGVQPDTCDSEVISIGGVDNIDASVFEAFDYVALGHLHGAQRIGRDTIRYAGSPLKYSFSEVHQKKSITVITLDAKGECQYKLIPLIPMREMREIKGPMEELLRKEIYSQGDRNDYMRVILTDEEELYAPLEAVRTIYPNVLRLDFENSRTVMGDGKLSVEEMKNKSPLDLIEEFYRKQNNQSMNVKQIELLKSLIGGALL